ncbi:MAG: DUF1289 domain-containing protein [Gammaproteobacteria bacterium]|nr:MAG: DUF1289 domain-containing protein [Gammaproteobacteria bacterium]
MSLTPSSSASLSPCVRDCCLNDDDICMGCGRSLEEITQWSASTKEDKEKILLRSADRKRLILSRQRR